MTDVISIELLQHYGEPIRGLLADPETTEICINRYDEIWIEKGGRLRRTDVQWPNERLFETYIRQIATSLGQEVHADFHPILDARLPDGTRINATLAPTAVDGSCMSIRPYPKARYTLTDLLRFGALTEEMAELLKLAVAHRLNIVIAGGTGSGKTTLLRCVCDFIPHDERVLAVEDTTENLLPDHPHRKQFEAPKRRTEQGTLEITMGALIANSLRQRPDRIVIGEIRTPEAASAFITAINTGHPGAISTIHANNALDALWRVEVQYAQQASNFTMDVVQAIVRSNIDMIAYAAREREGEGWVRRVTELLWVHDRRPVPLVEHRKNHGYVMYHAAIDMLRGATPH